MHLTLLFVCTSAVFTSIFALRNGGPANCCIKLNHKKVHVNQIVSYWRQFYGICPIEAIVFTLENGVFLCSDPNINWTKRAMRKVAEKAEQNQTSGMVPDASLENTQGLMKTLLTLASRWPQPPVNGTIKSSKPRHGPKKQMKIIKRKKNGKKQGRIRNQLVTMQPVFNLTSFTTYPSI